MAIVSTKDQFMLLYVSSSLVPKPPFPLGVLKGDLGMRLCLVLPHFIGSMVTSICWNDRTNMLAAMQDNKFVVWYHPAVVYADKDLLPLTIVHKEGRWVGVHVCGV